MKRKPLLFMLCWLCSTMLSWADGDVSITLSDNNRAATLRNGIVSIYIGETGKVESCLLKGATEAQDVQLIDTKQKQSFYFSCNQPNYAELVADATSIVANTTDMAHVTFSQTSATGIKWTQGYILRRGDSGYYTYLVAEGVGDNSLGEARIVYRLDDAKFRYGYVNSRMQGPLPDAAEMKRSEARVVQDATFTLDNGTIYTKYDWACYVKDDHFHGLIDEADGVGAWTIPVSTEYINGGPMRQDLTVHASDKSPLILQMLHGNHFGPQAQVYATGTKKIYGPFFFYINKGTRSEVIANAAAKATELESQWPFTWFSHELYPTERTTVNGCLTVDNDYAASPVRVVLSQTAEPYDEGDGYIYWAETESDGTFTIRNVRPGTYTLTAYALSGGNTSQLTREGIVVSGANTDLGNVVWRPERFGTEVFRIGESNRLSDGYKLSDADRSYSLCQESPDNLTFTAGSSNEATDWYYAQTKVGTWNIKFNVADPNHPFRLTAAAAGAANVTRINVNVNGTEMANNTWTYQNDGSVYRSAILSGRYQQHTLDLPAGVLKAGENTIALELSDHNYATSGIAGIMWDCIKLEMDEATETYDFTTMVSSFGDTNEHYPTYDGSRIFNYKPESSWIDIQKMSFAGFNLNNRFAAEARGSSSYNFRNAGSNWAGLNSGGNYARIFSILNLKVGDKVTIYYNQGNLSCYASSDYGTSGRGTVSGLANGDAVTTETEYTVTTAGRFDMISGTSKVNIKKIVIKTSAKVSVAIDASAGATTLVSTTPLDFTDSSLKAYYASAASNGEVTFSPVNKVAANTPIYIKGATGSYEINEFEGDADATPGNLLKGSASAATSLTSTANTKYYVFGVLNGEAGFYPVDTSKTLTSAAGKAYLQLTAVQAPAAAARISMVFNDGSETTGITTAEVSTQAEDNAWYTLQGVRVAQPTRGIYVRNGKKIIIK